eukprot:1383531-Amorphochlora_amoeboformis.AAC.1
MKNTTPAQRSHPFTFKRAQQGPWETPAPSSLSYPSPNPVSFQTVHSPKTILKAPAAHRRLSILPEAPPPERPLVEKIRNIFTFGAFPVRRPLRAALMRDIGFDSTVSVVTIGPVRQAKRYRWGGVRAETLRKQVRTRVYIRHVSFIGGRSSSGIPGLPFLIKAACPIHGRDLRLLTFPPPQLGDIHSSKASTVPHETHLRLNAGTPASPECVTTLGACLGP